jgi:hypothetical protein
MAQDALGWHWSVVLEYLVMQTYSVVVQRWPEIRVVARALMQRDRLDYGRVLETVAASPL